MKDRRNLKWYPAKDGRPAHYKTDISFRDGGKYRRYRIEAGFALGQAEDFLRRMIVAEREGNLDEFLGRKKKTVNSFGEYARYLLDTPNWKKKRSWQRDEYSLKNLLPKFGDKALDEITEKDWNEYTIDRSKNDKVSDATINRERSLIKSILNRAVREGMIEKNPLRYVERLEEPENRVVALRKMGLLDEKALPLQRKIIECSSPKLCPIVEVALITAMRQGEILELEWTDIDFKKGTITIRKEISKSKKDRIIPIGGRIAKILDSRERKSEHVFADDWTGNDKNRMVQREFQKAVEKAGMIYGLKNGGIVFHDTRHLAGSWMAEHNPIVVVKEIMGHSDINTTLRYVHTSKMSHYRAIEGSENRFSGRQFDDNGNDRPVDGQPAYASQVN